MTGLTTTTELEQRARKIREIITCVDQDLVAFESREFDEDYKVQRHPELTSEFFDLLEDLARELSSTLDTINEACSVCGCYRSEHSAPPADATPDERAVWCPGFQNNKRSMRVRLEPTTQLVTINGNVQGRVWHGTTNNGVPVQAVITRIACAIEHQEENERLAACLKECTEPCPEPRAFNARFVL